MGRGASLLLLGVVLSGGAAASSADSKRTTPASGAFLEGWDDFVLDGTGAPGALELRLHLGGEGWDNLRQSPPSADPVPVAAARSEARLTSRPFGRVPFKLHVEGGSLRFDGRPATSALGAGAGLEGERHNLNLSVRLERNRPSIDIGVGGDVTVDALQLRLRYALRTRRIEWWAGADRSRQRYPEAAFRDGTQQALQTGASFPGLARRWAPELSVAWSQNDGPGDSPFDWQQRRAQVGLRYTPTRAAALVARFEMSALAWGVTRPGAVNFARRDRRRAFGLQGQVRVTRQAAWTIAYDRVDSSSTRDNRAFTADAVALSLIVRLGSTSAAASAPPPGAPRPPLPRPPLRQAGTATSPVLLEPVAAIEDESPAPPVLAAGLLGVTRIETAHAASETATTLRGEGLVSYSTLALDGPPRFVVDLVGVAAGPLSVAVDTPLLRGIRVAAFRQAPTRVARVVFDLKAPVAAAVERDGETLRIVLRPVRATASSAGTR